MKLSKYICLAFLSCSLLSSCADKWTEPEAEVFENQQGLKRLIPFLETKGWEDLTPTMQKHYEEIKEYRKKDRVLGFGWFGNWSAKGDDPMGYLKALPDSVDMISLWGTRGMLTEEQKQDLKYFQEVKHGKAMLCWIVQDTGDQLTPVGRTAQDYWLTEKGGGDYHKAAEAYADAIADTIAKYNLDGFDIDLEPGYGHYSRWSQIAQSSNITSNTVMYAFIKRLYDRFQEMEAKDGKHRLIAVDGEPNYLTNESAKMVDYFILQAYWESSSASALRKIQSGGQRTSHLENYQRKTIITVEFERHWRTGTVPGYSSSKYPELNGKDGAQLFDYATLDYPNGVRIAGIGSYHMEYDKRDHSYKWLRAALDRANKEIPGNFTPSAPTPTN